MHSAGRVSNHILDRLVQDTLVTSSTSSSVTSDELTALQCIARKYGGVPLELDPIGFELVQALLTTYYLADSDSSSTEKDPGRPEHVWAERMSRPIARTLFEDDCSRERLEVLWLQLAESVR